MGKIELFLVIVLSAIIGCVENKQSTDDIITVDVTETNYPKKELILQDFMDVEYIPLETNDDFLNQGFVMDIGEKFIVVRNRNEDGDIFIYDRAGKAIRKINHKGQGGEEYIDIFKITLDEESGEIFVDDIYTKKIIVYDLYGKFKRSFKHKERTTYTEIYNFDKGHLICYDRFISEYGEANRQSFMIISKQNGSITKEIQIPFKEKILTAVISKNEKNQMLYAPLPYFKSIIPYEDNWILVEFSSDTIYRYSSGYNMTPFFVRTPPVQSMDPKVLLLLRLLSDRYYFMETRKNVYDFSTGRGFPATFLMYDRQEKAFFKYTVYNGDYSTKKEIYMNALKPVNHEIESWQSLEAFQLVESYRKGELKGKLKEIAATLSKESNPVIMLIKHKKAVNGK
jgi:hypothetical protein